jgi:hypothetical protein
MLLNTGARRPGHGNGGMGLLHMSPLKGLTPASASPSPIASARAGHHQQHPSISSPAAMGAASTIVAPALPPDLPPLDPASNARCWHMAREAQLFSRELMALRTALAEHASSVAAVLGVGGSSASIASMLAAPLPRVWDSVDGRLAEPLRATSTHYGPGAGTGESRLAHTVGGGGAVPPFAALEAAAAELLAKVDGRILAPLDAWQRDLALATSRLPVLERLRAELGAAIGRASEARARAEEAEAAGAADAAATTKEPAAAQQHEGQRRQQPYYRVRLVPAATGGAAAGGGAAPLVTTPSTAGATAATPRGRRGGGRRGPLGALMYACTHVSPWLPSRSLSFSLFCKTTGAADPTGRSPNPPACHQKKKKPTKKSPTP